MSIRSLFGAALLLLFSHTVLCHKTLILVENYGVKETHSIFLGYLTSAGHEVTYKMADDSTLSLFHFGDLSYDNVVILAPSTQDFGGDLNSAVLAEYIDAGGNVFVVADSTIGDAIRDFGYECGVEFDEAGSKVIDHLNFDASDSAMHSKLFIDPKQILDNKLITGATPKNPIVYEGIGMLLDEENELLVPVVSATSTAYSFFPYEKITEHPDTVGKKTALVVALQGRNNARVMLIGSMSMLSDKFILSGTQKGGSDKVFASNGNGPLVESLIKWTFKQVGVLRISEVKHHLEGEKDAPAFYTVTEKVVYKIKIEENVGNSWVEFKNNDVQLEFVRIDPFVRFTMQKEKGYYVSKFTLPDVYGVFQFKVNYERQGYTFLSSATQVPVRPLKHNQYERFIPVAYPYYASAFSMMIGVLIFSFVFLHFKEPASTSGKQKSN